MKGAVVRDKRMFVTIDDYSILMTTFLRVLQDDIFKFGQRGKPVRKLRDNLIAILDKINAEAGGVAGRKKGGLYNKKLDSQIKNYQGLKSTVTNPILNTRLTGWMYDIEKSNFTVKVV